MCPIPNYVKCSECHLTSSEKLISPDLIACNVINELLVFCLFQSRGCPWQGEVQELENHNARCEHKQLPNWLVGSTVLLEEEGKNNEFIEVTENLSREFKEKNGSNEEKNQEKVDFERTRSSEKEACDVHIEVEPSSSSIVIGLVKEEAVADLVESFSDKPKEEPDECSSEAKRTIESFGIKRKSVFDKLLFLEKRISFCQEDNGPKTIEETMGDDDDACLKPTNNSPEKSEWIERGSGFSTKEKKEEMDSFNLKENKGESEFGIKLKGQGISTKRSAGFLKKQLTYPTQTEKSPNPRPQLEEKNQTPTKLNLDQEILKCSSQEKLELSKKSICFRSISKRKLIDEPSDKKANRKRQARIHEINFNALDEESSESSEDFETFLGKRVSNALQCN